MSLRIGPPTLMIRDNRKIFYDADPSDGTYLVRHNVRHLSYVDWRLALVAFPELRIIAKVSTV